MFSHLRDMLLVHRSISHIPTTFPAACTGKCLIVPLPSSAAAPDP